MSSIWSCFEFFPVSTFPATLPTEPSTRVGQAVIMIDLCAKVSNIPSSPTVRHGDHARTSGWQRVACRRDTRKADDRGWSCQWGWRMGILLSLVYSEVHFALRSFSQQPASHKVRHHNLFHHGIISSGTSLASSARKSAKSGIFPPQGPRFKVGDLFHVGFQQPRHRIMDAH